MDTLVEEELRGLYVMVRHKLNATGTDPALAPRRAKRMVAASLAIVLSAAVFVGSDAIGRSVDAGASGASATRASALKSKAPKVTVTTVAASSTVTSSGTTVRTNLKVKNSASVRKPALHARLYLTTGSKKYTLGQATVKPLAAGASRTIHTTHSAPRGVAAGRYSVLACTANLFATIL